MSAPLVLSLFPGADLLGRAFELEGCCVVRGPDVLFGHDFDDWTPPPAGAFDGIIAGPPCQPHSLARRGAPARHRDYLPDCFALVARLRPAWAVIENVPNALNEHPAPAGERQTILEALLQLSPTSAALRDPLAVCDGAGLQGERQ